MIPVVALPLRKLEDGLTQIEYRAFRELVEYVGTHRAVIVDGAEMSDRQIDDARFERFRGRAR